MSRSQVFNFLRGNLIITIHTGLEAKLAKHPACTVWGTGRATREFLYVDDLADACVLLLTRPTVQVRMVLEATGGVVNVGSGEEIEILALAQLIKQIVGYEGELILDPSKPDGAPRKVLDSRRMNALGWSASTPLRVGLRQTYEWYVEHKREPISVA